MKHRQSYKRILFIGESIQGHDDWPWAHNARVIELKYHAQQLEMYQDWAFAGKGTIIPLAAYAGIGYRFSEAVFIEKETFWKCQDVSSLVAAVKRLSMRTTALVGNIYIRN